MALCWRHRLHACFDRHCCGSYGRRAGEALRRAATAPAISQAGWTAPAGRSRSSAILRTTTGPSRGLTVHGPGPSQFLPGQKTRPHWNPPPRTAHDQAGQPARQSQVRPGRAVIGRYGIRYRPVARRLSSDIAVYRGSVSRNCNSSCSAKSSKSLTLSVPRGRPSTRHQAAAHESLTGRGRLLRCALACNSPHVVATAASNGRSTTCRRQLSNSASHRGPQFRSVVQLVGGELLRIDTVCMTNRDTLSAWHQLSACVSILRLYER